MDQIIIRSTLLCVLIFGLCEAHWKIQDNWPKNARPLSKDEIELTAEAKMSVIKNDTRDSIQSIQEEIKACQEGIVVQAEKESDEIRNERFETQEKLQNSEYDSMMYDDNDSLERYYAREELSKICSHQNGMIQKLEAKLQVLKDEEKRKIDNIQYQMQQYLSDSEQGFTRRSRVEIDMPNVSFDLTVPYGKTVIYLGNTIKKPQRSDAIKFCVETDPETLFPFELDYTGPLYGINGNATHLHAEILSADGLKIFNYAGDLKQSPYQISMDNNSTLKTLVYTNPDGTIYKLHQTMERLENNIFTQDSKIWKYDGEIKWSLGEESVESIDLNDPQKEVVLTGLCQSSLNIKKYEGNQMVSEKRLICKYD